MLKFQLGAGEESTFIHSRRNFPSIRCRDFLGSRCPHTFNTAIYDPSEALSQIVGSKEGFFNKWLVCDDSFQWARQIQGFLERTTVTAILAGHLSSHTERQFVKRKVHWSPRDTKWLIHGEGDGTFTCSDQQERFRRKFDFHNYRDCLCRRWPFKV